jgi:putative transposase
MAKSTNPFRWFDSSPELIRLAVVMYVRCLLSRRNALGNLGYRFADHQGLAGKF